MSSELNGNLNLNDRESALWRVEKNPAVCQVFFMGVWITVFASDNRSNLCRGTTTHTDK